MFTSPSTVVSHQLRHIVCNRRIPKKTPHEIDLAPIGRVLTLAVKAGMIDAELCRRMVVQQQHLNNWKARGLPAARHARAAEIFGVSIDYIAKGVAESSDMRGTQPLPVDTRVDPALFHEQNAPAVAVEWEGPLVKEHQMLIEIWNDLRVEDRKEWIESAYRIAAARTASSMRERVEALAAQPQAAKKSIGSGSVVKLERGTSPP